MTKLLLRFYDPTTGRITLDGHDLRDLGPEVLRANIAIVLQETLLLDGTIAENIRAGRPDATHADLITAADAHEPITALPHGYDTRVGQRGRLLSGGQRQRIAIVISHNLTTVTDAHRIIYLDHGHVTETGTHLELLTQDGGYAHLYRLHHPTSAGPIVPTGPHTGGWGYGLPQPSRCPSSSAG